MTSAVHRFALLSRSALTAACLLALASGPAAAGTGQEEPAELEIGAAAPGFDLAGVDGKRHTLAEYKEAEALAVVFTCLSCPFARAYEGRLLDMAREYAERGVQFVAVMSNDTTIKPADSFDNLKARSKEMDYPFLYLVDETQGVAKAYGAKVTPHVFLFDAKRKLAYRGRIDDATEIDKVEHRDLVNALDALLSGEAVPVAATKAFGCSIKWSKDKAS